MTFPTLVGITGYASSGNSTSWAIFSGVTVKKGSVLIVGAGDSGATLTTASAGWQLLGQVNSSAGPDSVASAVFRATADNTAFTLTSDQNDEYSAILVRVTGGGTVSGTGLANSANPPSHSVGSTRDVLWVSANVVDGSDTTPTGAPSGYSSFTAQLGQSGGADTAAAYRTNNAASENPGAFTGGSSSGVVWTIALYARRKIRAGGTL